MRKRLIDSFSGDEDDYIYGEDVEEEEDCKRKTSTDPNEEDQLAISLFLDRLQLLRVECAQQNCAIASKLVFAGGPCLRYTPGSEVISGFGAGYFEDWENFGDCGRRGEPLPTYKFQRQRQREVVPRGFEAAKSGKRKKSGAGSEPSLRDLFREFLSMMLKENEQEEDRDSRTRRTSSPSSSSSSSSSMVSRRFFSPPLPQSRRRKTTPEVGSRAKTVQKKPVSFDKRAKSKGETEKQKKQAKKPVIPWKPTVPKPFQMTIRESQKASSADAHRTIAQRRMEALIAERDQRERREMEERRSHKIRAVPVPASTYIPDTRHFIRNLNRRLSKSLPALAAEQNEGQRFRSSTPHPFHARPPPVSTFVPPSVDFEQRRAARLQQRALELLASAHEPRGITEHSTRWRVQQRLRHEPRCFAPVPDKKARECRFSGPDYTRPGRDPPNFQSLLDRFEWALANRAAAIRRPLTVPRPFEFRHREHLVTAHHCPAGSTGRTASLSGKKNPIGNVAAQRRVRKPHFE